MIVIQTLFVAFIALVIVVAAAALIVLGARRLFRGDDSSCWMVISGVGLLLLDYALIDCWTVFIGLGS